MPNQSEQSRTNRRRGGFFDISPEQRGLAAKVFMISAVILVMVFIVINSFVQLNEVYADVSAANVQLSELRSENVQMQTQLEGMASISNIKTYAENYLGLQQLDKSQIQYIEIQTEDEVVVEEGAQNIFVRLRHWFQDIVAYLRG